MQVQEEMREPGMQGQEEEKEKAKEEEGPLPLLAHQESQEGEEGVETKRGGPCRLLTGTPL